MCLTLLQNQLTEIESQFTILNAFQLQAEMNVKQNYKLTELHTGSGIEWITETFQQLR